MSKRHYHIVLNDKTGHATMARIDGPVADAIAEHVIPTPVDRQAQRAFVQALIDSGSFSPRESSPI